ncbi:MAG TPA: choice-of-anchor tandem repeat GloVer-containing protein [Rhizomicrobium sp.]|jgi:uncharacterized repeat protein (TIGR03803 family)|nr:choice-of-anchor tandem repeat GloVer-containing protein [Rhizomicrobium sp.]
MFSNCALFRGALLGSAVALAVFASAASAKPGYKVVHDFAGPPDDGAYPLVGVIFDDAGDIYGVTYVGGAYSLGTLFKIAPDGTETIVRSFGSGNDGAFPRSQPAIDKSGNIYGTTNGGGGSINCDGGCGTIWEYSAGGKYKVLHNFDFTDGSQPVGQLLRDAAGNFYGITTNGGANNQGEVFEYTAGGKFKVLHTFAGTDGAYPECSLIQDRAGNMYGTTEGGGAGNDGTVFEIQSGGQFTILYSFTGGNDGANPVGGLDRDKSGNLYGTAENGGANSVGIVFRLTPDGTFSTLYSFAGGTDGANPQGDILRVKDTLYGATSSGGDSNGYGVVYKVDIASGAETVLHRFTGTDGSTSVSKLAWKQGKLYGAAAYGGADGNGVVFSVARK